MKEQLKQLQHIEERIDYLIQIKDYSNWGNLDGFKTSSQRLKQTIYDFSEEEVSAEIRKLKPRSLRFCALLEKTARREVGAQPDFVGFSIGDHFVIGYGLDFAERYRNLPFIGVLKPEAQNPPEWQ